MIKNKQLYIKFGEKDGIHFFREFVADNKKWKYDSNPSRGFENGGSSGNEISPRGFSIIDIDDTFALRFLEINNDLWYLVNIQDRSMEVKSGSIEQLFWNEMIHQVGLEISNFCNRKYDSVKVMITI